MVATSFPDYAGSMLNVASRKSSDLMIIRTNSSKKPELISGNFTEILKNIEYQNKYPPLAEIMESQMEQPVG